MVLSAKQKIDILSHTVSHTAKSVLPVNCSKIQYEIDIELYLPNGTHVFCLTTP